jgi:hypothetical protein
MLMFLKSSDGLVLTGSWAPDENGGTPLKDVVADLRRIFKKLGSLGSLQDYPIETVPGEGYKLDRGSIPASIGELPQLLWVETLLDLVRAGKWIRVPVLPGDGAEDVRVLLQRNFPEAALIPVNLAPIVGGSELLLSIAGATGGDSNHNAIAQEAAGSANLLVILVQGWGQHARVRGVGSLRSLATTLQGFLNVRKPRVVVVLLSPIPTSHLPGSPAEGSLLELETVGQSAQDTEVKSKWARELLSNTAKVEVEALLQASYAQIGAIRAAVRVANLSKEDRLQAVAQAHEEAGESILNSLGPCCAEVLIGRSRKAGCVRVLKNARILEERNGVLQARVQAWTSSWGLPEEAP